MTMDKVKGTLMASEIAEAPLVFARAAAQNHTDRVKPLDLTQKRAIYTIARGSSDAAANILSYEFMRELGLPVTSLPPSVFSLGKGVAMTDAAALVISQSGASDDLVRSAKGIKARGGAVLAITNQPGSNVEAASDLTLPIAAGPERAVPATKSVVGAIAAGMALLAALKPSYIPRALASADVFAGLRSPAHPRAADLTSALLRAQHVYVIGRDTGYGAAQEIALKLKECCALHAEAYSSSEVLHGPLQLVTKPLTILILDTGQADIQDSLDTAEKRFIAAGGAVHRIRPADIGATGLTPAAAAALLLCLLYPVVLATAVALGHDPDAPATLSKVTQTT
jgi:glucosamine--fructose-6-phosphate aminotransferase (isomerizing)